MIIATIARAAKGVVPGYFRLLWRRHRMRRRHGLAGVGMEAADVVARCSFGRNCRLGGPVVLRNCTIGDYSYIEVGSRITDSDIGKFCSIAPSVIIGMAEHPARDFVSSHPFFYSPRPYFGYVADRYYFNGHSRTRIGNDVWIGAGACVKGGVTIHDGAIIGAGAVVTKDVPPYEIHGGIPARRIRGRFDDESVRFLLEFRWWDRGEEWLRANYRLFHDIEAFRRAAECGTFK